MVMRYVAFAFLLTLKKKKCNYRETVKIFFIDLKFASFLLNDFYSNFPTEKTIQSTTLPADLCFSFSILEAFAALCRN